MRDIRTLTLVTCGTTALDPVELARKENVKEFPRVSLFSKRLNSDLLDERFIQNLPLKKRTWYSHLPMCAVQILEAYSRRNQYDAVISWAEKLGIPLALLMKMTGRRVPHIGLFSWISKPKKAQLLKMVQSHFDRIILMSSIQWDFAVNSIGIPREKVVLLKWPVDQEFWMPTQIETDMICAVGREMRDYRTLWIAMEGLPIHCHIAAGGMTDRKRDKWKEDPKRIDFYPK